MNKLPNETKPESLRDIHLTKTNDTMLVFERKKSFCQDMYNS